MVESQFVQSCPNHDIFNVKYILQALFLIGMLGRQRLTPAAHLVELRWHNQVVKALESALNGGGFESQCGQ